MTFTQHYFMFGCLNSKNNRKELQITYKRYRVSFELS